MRRVLIAAALVVPTFAFSQLACAADMPVKAPPVAATPAAYTSWSGFYVGGHLGGASGRIAATDLQQPVGGIVVPAGVGFPFSYEDTGFAGGLHGGGQYQFANNLVLGAEATWTWTDIDQTTDLTYFPGFGTETAKITDLLTIVGRVGYAFDRWLAYAKGGYAGGHVSILQSISLVGGVTSYEQELWQNGYTFGGGIEYAILNNVRLGIDYTHIELGKKTGTGLSTGAFVIPQTLETYAHANMIMARLTLFWGGP